MIRLKRLFVAFVLLAGCSLNCSAGMMYWSEIVSTRVSRANLDGTGVEILPFGSVTVRDVSLDLDAGKLYGTDLSGVVGRSNLDGSGLESLVSGVGVTPWGIELDLVNDLIYWTDRDADSIFRASLDGSSPAAIISTGQPRGIRVDSVGGKIYWADSGTGGAQAILKANLDGTGLETVVSGFRPQFLDLDIANSHIYWTDFSAGTITRTTFDSSASMTLISGLLNPKGIQLDLAANQFYWAESGSGLIRRASLDGSNVETLVSGLSDPSGIALDLSFVAVPEPSPAVLFALGMLGFVAMVGRRKN